MKKDLPQYRVGQIVYHLKFDYRGVIVQVDSHFRGQEEWYEKVAVSRPAKDKPWYHILVEKADHVTYVAERHIELAENSAPVDHPLISYYFDRYAEGFYQKMAAARFELKGLS